MTVLNAFQRLRPRARALPSTGGTIRGRILVTLRTAAHGLSIAEIAAATGIKPTSVSNAVGEMNRQQSIRQYGHDARGAWRYEATP